MSNLNQHQTKNLKIKRLVLAALFSALAYIATLLTSWIRVSGFLTFDTKDTVITIAGLILGPIYSVVISLVVSLIEIIVVPETGFWGFLMNFLSTAVFACVCSLIYKYKKNIKGATIGLCVSVLSVTATMIILNLVVTPLYSGQPVSVIASMIPTIFLPFNFTKALLNAALVLMFYKPVSRALKATRMTVNYKESSSPVTTKQKILINVIVYGIGIVISAVSVLIFIFVLGGEFTF